MGHWILVDVKCDDDSWCDECWRWHHRHHHRGHCHCHCHHSHSHCDG
jgi:hypothetical protein